MRLSNSLNAFQSVTFSGKNGSNPVADSIRKLTDIGMDECWRLSPPRNSSSDPVYLACRFENDWLVAEAYFNCVTTLLTQRRYKSLSELSKSEKSIFWTWFERWSRYEWKASAMDALEKVY